MKRLASFFGLIFFLPLLSTAQTVVSMQIDGAINPVSADFIRQGIEKARNEKAQCLIIHLNTPGGLLKSTRMIVSDMLESPVPIIVYVAPAGAHAGSAGVFITMAANIAAMAPGTNIGAAHPVNLQAPVDPVMDEKTTNDAAAFIRTIAEKRNRNLQWGEEAVRKSLAITASEALEKNVIDIVAVNEQELLSKIDGRSIELNSGSVTIHTRGASVSSYQMSFIDKLLDLISDPDISYILMMLGMFGIMFELYNPGAILPGIVGVISLILAFYSMQSLPVNYAGLALIIFAIVLFLLEIKIVSHGLLAIGGIVSLLLGSMMLIRPGSGLEIASISRSVIFSSVLVTSAFFLFVLGAGLRAQRRKPVTGIDGMIGVTGVSMSALDPLGTVRVHGELWKAESITGTIGEGEQVRVTGINNLKLFVENIKS